MGGARSSICKSQADKEGQLGFGLATSIKEILANAAGDISKVLLPIRHDYVLGGGKAIAIRTLSSIDLLKRMCESERVMKNVAVVGRLFSENKGVDAMISFALRHPELNKIIVCGLEVKGHLAGQALVSLQRKGIDKNGRIIGARGPHPILCSQHLEVDMFRSQVRIVDMIGTTDFERISALVP